MYAVGIDISKGKSTIAINCDGELLYKPFEISHTEEGFEILLDKIKGIKKENVRFVMEATGIFYLVPYKCNYQSNMIITLIWYQITLSHYIKIL